MRIARKLLPPRHLSSVPLASIPSGLLLSLTPSPALLALVSGPVVHQSPLFLWHPRVGGEGEDQRPVAVPLPAPTPLTWAMLGTVASGTSWMRPRAHAHLWRPGRLAVGHHGPWSGHKCPCGPSFLSFSAAASSSFGTFLQRTGCACCFSRPGWCSDWDR